MDSHDHRERPSPNPPSETHTVRLNADEPVAMSIVYAVADTLRRQPLDLEPLSTQVDPEALETLLNGPIGQREELTVSFSFADCMVTLTPTRIHVSPSGDSE
jgi:hypothetical protein